MSRRIHEENALTLRRKGPMVYGFGIDDEFVSHGKVSELNRSLGLDTKSMFDKILRMELSSNG